MLAAIKAQLETCDEKGLRIMRDCYDAEVLKQAANLLPPERRRLIFDWVTADNESRLKKTKLERFLGL